MPFLTSFLIPFPGWEAYGNHLELLLVVFVLDSGAGVDRLRGTVYFCSGQWWVFAPALTRVTYQLWGH